MYLFVYRKKSNLGRRHLENFLCSKGDTSSDLDGFTCGQALPENGSTIKKEFALQEHFLSFQPLLTRELKNFCQSCASISISLKNVFGFV